MTTTISWQLLWIFLEVMEIPAQLREIVEDAPLLNTHLDIIWI